MQVAPNAERESSDSWDTSYASLSVLPVEDAGAPVDLSLTLGSLPQSVLDVSEDVVVLRSLSSTWSDASMLQSEDLIASGTLVHQTSLTGLSSGSQLQWVDTTGAVEDVIAVYQVFAVADNFSGAVPLTSLVRVQLRPAESVVQDNAGNSSSLVVETVHSLQFLCGQNGSGEPELSVVVQATGFRSYAILRAAGAVAPATVAVGQVVSTGTVANLDLVDRSSLNLSSSSTHSYAIFFEKQDHSWFRAGECQVTLVSKQGQRPIGNFFKWMASSFGFAKSLWIAQVAQW